MRLLVWLLALSACVELSQDDVQRVKQSIRLEFGSRKGVRVVEVVMVRESRTTMTGYVRLEVGGESVLINCAATLYPDADPGQNLIWKCPALGQ